MTGADRDATGTLISMDGNEGVFKLDTQDQDSNITMVPLNTLCKLND